MADALRRILLGLPLLLLGAVLLFSLLGASPLTAQTLTRPLFYNPAPESAESASLEALELVQSDLSLGTKRLTELGGAALPYVLPRLGQLPIDSRRRVALALDGVAARLDPTFLARPAVDADARLVYWDRYQDDHQLDFRPLVVARIVHRLGTQARGLRAADLRVVDTYALPALVAEIGRIRSRDDIERVSRLTPHIARLTGHPFAIEGDASVREARQVATEIRSLWDVMGPRYTPLDPVARLVAHVTQTEFSTWLARTARELARIDSPNLVERFVGHGRLTVGFLASALLGALVVGPVLAGALELLRFRRLRFAEVWLPRAGLGLALTIVMPTLVLGGTSNPAAGSIVSALVGALGAAFVLHREVMDRMDWRSHVVLGRRRPLERILALGTWLLPSLPTLVPLLFAELVTSVLVLEIASNASGIGSVTLTALKQGDVPWIMAVCLVFAALTSVTQVLADAFVPGREQRGR